MSDPQQQRTRGQIHIYTGDGKGKTTAALGLAIRAVGAGKKVAIVYFDKGGTHYSERTVLTERFTGNIDWFACGLDRIDQRTGRFRFGVTDEDRAEAQRGFGIVQELVAKGGHDLLILDEINSTVDLGILAKEPVVAFINAKPEALELVLTGRNAPPEFRERADLVSEVTLKDHYFYRGVPAREGFDF
jgi:cob(I)alamin adenosyltransferase